MFTVMRRHLDRLLNIFLAVTRQLQDRQKTVEKLNSISASSERTYEELDSIRTVLRTSQQRTFPRKMREFGLDLIVREGVFPPEDFQSWRWFSENFPPFTGKTILEIGCGFGLPGLLLAKTGALSLLACDINPKAVANTLENAARNGIKNVGVIESDIFSNIPPGRKFDIIFWNHPWNFAPADFELDDLERGAFDPGYSLLERFLSEGREFLTERGKILLGFGLMPVTTFSSDS